MRVAILIHELLVEGGTERQCLSLARALAEQGHQVTVFTNAHDSRRCYADLGHQLDIRVVGRGGLSRLGRPRLLRRLLDARRLSRALLDLTEPPYDVINAHHWPPHWAAVWVKQKRSWPVVWTCNDLPSAWLGERNGLWGLLRRLAYVPVQRFDQSKAVNVDVIAVLDDRMAGLMAKSYPGAQIKVVRTGVDLDKFGAGPARLDVRSEHGLRPKSYLLLCLAILMPHRRFEDAVTAVEMVRRTGTDVQLLIMGSLGGAPAYVQRIRNLIRSLGLQQDVILGGRVADGEIASYYRACDAFLFPNEEQTWGLAVIEAMACGKPVIVSTGAGVHEVLEDGVTAILVPPRSPQRLAGKIARLIGEPVLADRVAANGQRFVRAAFSWENYATSMAAVFAALTSVNTMASSATLVPPGGASR